MPGSLDVAVRHLIIWDTNPSAECKDCDKGFSIGGPTDELHPFTSRLNNWLDYLASWYTSNFNYDKWSELTSTHSPPILSIVEKQYRPCQTFAETFYISSIISFKCKPFQDVKTLEISAFRKKYGNDDRLWRWIRYDGMSYKPWISKGGRKFYAGIIFWIIKLICDICSTWVNSNQYFNQLIATSTFKFNSTSANITITLVQQLPSHNLPISIARWGQITLFVNPP